MSPDSLLSQWDQLQVSHRHVGFGDANRLAESFIATEQFRVKVCKRFEGFPCESLVFARRNPTNEEMPVLIGDCSFVEIGSIAILTGDEYGGDSSCGLPLLIRNSPLELPSSCAEDNLQRR